MADWLPWRRKKAQPTLEAEQAPESPKAEERAVEAGSQPASTAGVIPSRQSIWRRGLSRLRQSFRAPLDRVLRGRAVDEGLFSELEEVLLSADVGVQETLSLVERLRARCKQDRPTDAEALQAYLKEEMLQLLRQAAPQPLVGEARPWVILMVGINGVGKTTTVAKLAARFCQERKKVLLVAADTFRAAASEQLEVWADRLGVDIIKHQAGASPAAVAFDGIRAAIGRKVDVVLIDTAGRLHTRTPLMEELRKVHRVVAKELAGAPHEVLLVLDGTTGQNALSQAQTFRQAVPLTGVVLTKMDGSGKGGVVLSIADKLGVPIRCIGLGERAEDLQDFRAQDFVEALFETNADE